MGRTLSGFQGSDFNGPIAGPLTITDTTNAASATNGGAFTSSGGGAVALDFYVGDDLSVGDTITAGASTLSSAAVTGNATVGGTLGVTGAATFNAAATVGTTLGVTGTATVGALGTAGTFNSTNTTAAASAVDTNAAFHTGGGAAIEKNVYVGTTLNVAGVSTFGDHVNIGNTDEIRIATGGATWPAQHISSRDFGGVIIEAQDAASNGSMLVGVQSTGNSAAFAEKVGYLLWGLGGWATTDQQYTAWQLDPTQDANNAMLRTNATGAGVVPGLKIFTGNNTNQLVLTTAGNVTMSGTLGVTGATSTGALTSGNIAAPQITFSSGSQTALTGYKEGTWTPVLTNTDPAGADLATWSTGPYGFYTRIGNLVRVSFRGIWSASSDGTGDLIIGGLPYAPLTTTGYRAFGSCRMASLTGTATTTAFVAFTGGESAGFNTCVHFANQETAGGAATTTNLGMDTAATVQFSLTYHTAAAF